MSSLPARMIADLIGKPYLDRGRGPNMFDCEGLFLEVQRRRGYEGCVPFLGNTKQRARGWMQIADATWTQLATPRPGCAVFFPADLHVGTVYDAGRFLHTSSELGEAFLDTFDSPHWDHKKRLFYDWVPLETIPLQRETKHPERETISASLERK